jgi:hypothetical protein
VAWKVLGGDILLDDPSAFGPKSFGLINRVGSVNPESLLNLPKLTGRETSGVKVQPME